MTSWQRGVRLGFAAIGIASAALVYAGYRSRQPAPPPTPIARLDPKAIVESTAGFLQQVRGLERDYEIKFDRQLLYENGRSKLFDVVVSVKKKDGRDFIVTAREADAGENQRELRLTRDVKLVASDGFELTTDRAVFNQDEGLVRADGPVAFSKGRMNGSGTGMTYNKNTDVLGIGTDAKVKMTDENGGVTMDFTSSSATLDRVQDLLLLEGSVHVLRDAQTLEADRSTAHMSENDDYVTFIELRGNSRVEGGSGTLDAMTARDIDLDYTDDGQALEKVTLTENASIAMAGQNGAAGRQLIGGALALELAPDGSVTRASGQNSIRVGLPATDAVPARSIAAKVMDATGEAGKGLTNFRFAEQVEYREEGRKGSAPRKARSQSLRLTMDQDAVASAVFNGSVTFDEEGLTAGGAEAQYHPDNGTLDVSGRDAGGPSRVADEHLTIEAGSINIGLEDRKMAARTGVKTLLRPRPATASSASAPGGSTRFEGQAAAKGDVTASDTKTGSRLPGLLQQDKAANVTSDRLQYEGEDGDAIFTGKALLWQGETAVRADAITIDQRTGNLAAVGSARSTIAMDEGASQGSANQIRYDDMRRALTYDSSPPPPAGRGTAAGRGGATPGAAEAAPTPPAAAPAPARPAAGGRAQMSRAKQDLSAQKIEVFLAPETSAVERVEAYVAVNAHVEKRVASGNRLTFHADTDRYDMTGIPGTAVKVVDGCRQIVGKTLTFFTSTDRIIVDGSEQTQTRTSSAPCAQSPSR